MISPLAQHLHKIARLKFQRSNGKAWVHPFAF